MTADDLAEIFGEIYERDDWTLVDADDAVSRSGLGSNLEQTQTLRRELPPLLRELGVRSMLDIPCGDMFWMSRVDPGVDAYIGADVVPAVVERNRRLFAGPGREFRVIDLVRDDLPLVDLIFSRDCLVHLSNDHAKLALANVRRSGAEYLAATTFTERTWNRDIAAGDWRPINLCKPPFNLPDPIRLLNERCTEVYFVERDGKTIELRFPDKSIAVWRIADI
ncbi:class I SAM-dependent methyltransferase [Dactylosporangium sp. NPDC050688]|uniref:class I SAM-dependent methyltransferase n=1 Tax=Dactylosporangium sp. NPDC050688 TaxID=3157217 RepID=UPI0033C7D9A1